jgi:hypothetical protein
VKSTDCEGSHYVISNEVIRNVPETDKQHASRMKNSILPKLVYVYGFKGQRDMVTSINKWEGQL